MSDKPFSTLSLRAQHVLSRLEGLEPRDKLGLIFWWECQQNHGGGPDGPRRALMQVRGCGVTVYAEILEFVSAKPDLEAIKRDVHEVFKEAPSNIELNQGGLRDESCAGCSFRAPTTSLCHRYPRQVSVSPDHWCGEYQAVETA